MEKIAIDGLTLFFSPEDQDSLELIRQACEKSMRLLKEHWGLHTPKDCRIHIMTSWQSFVFQSAPLAWKVLLAGSWPLWAGRVNKLWSIAGGWQQNYGRKVAVGVKPPRLIEVADRRIGQRVFIQEKNIGEKVQSITCHELTHAFTAHLRLPTWLKEGTAMLMVDKFFEGPTVKDETLEALERRAADHGPRGHQKVPAREDTLVYLYAFGYWLTRYLEETHPALLKDLLSVRYQRHELEDKVATAYGKGVEEFWPEIDGNLVSYFKGNRKAVT